MKIFFSQFLLLAALLAVFQTASAYDFSADNGKGVTLYYTVLPDSSCALTSGAEPYEGDVEIPAAVTFGRKTYPVSAIDSEAFLGCEALVSVSLPQGLKTIGGFAFSCCTSLGGLDIPEGVQSIGAYAFSGCHQLKSVVIPRSVATLSDFAFYGCSRLASVAILGRLETMGYNVFEGTPWWDMQPQGFVYHDDVLLGCHGDIYPTMAVKEGTRLIANGAFYDRSTLSWLDIPQSVEKIGSSAFYNCAGLTSIRLPENIRQIDEYTFYKCKNLASILLPDSLRSIGWYAFAGCSALVSVELPKNLSDIGAEAFRGCVGLARLESHAALPPSCYANAFVGVSRADCLLSVPDGTAAAYLAAVPWNEFNVLMPGEMGAMEQCATPLIAVNDGQLSIESETPNSICHYTITSSDIHSSHVAAGSAVPLSGQYTVTAYAKADGMLDSQLATAILVWVNPDQLYDNIINLEQKKAVVLRIDGSNAVLCGTEAGEEIVLYSANGAALLSMKAVYGETRLPYTLQKGQVYVVQYANRGIKVAL